MLYDEKGGVKVSTPHTYTHKYAAGAATEADNDFSGSSIKRESRLSKRLQVKGGQLEGQKMEWNEAMGCSESADANDVEKREKQDHAFTCERVLQDERTRMVDTANRVLPV